MHCGATEEWLRGDFLPRLKSWPEPVPVQVNAVALDDLQIRILKTIAINRHPESHVAGGAVLQRNGPRLSDDIDVFHHDETGVESYARRDLETLRTAGFSFDVTRRYAC